MIIETTAVELSNDRPIGADPDDERTAARPRRVRVRELVRTWWQRLTAPTGAGGRLALFGRRVIALSLIAALVVIGSVVAAVAFVLFGALLLVSALFGLVTRTQRSDDAWSRGAT